jgi:hypothetical protein
MGDPERLDGDDDVAVERSLMKPEQRERRRLPGPVVPVDDKLKGFVGV